MFACFVFICWFRQAVSSLEQELMEFWLMFPFKFFKKFSRLSLFTLLFSLVFLPVWCACTVTSSLAQGVNLGASRAMIHKENGVFNLKIENIDLNSLPLSVTWTLDMTTANWTLSGALWQPGPDLQFTPDPGIRVDRASIPGAAVDPVTGTVYLCYEDHSGGEGPGEKMVQSSSDGLNFSNPAPYESLPARLDPRAVLLPDGTWRKYIFNHVQKNIISQSTSDGLDYTDDEGVRYGLDPSDNGTFGVYDVYVDHKKDVIMLYIGDMGGNDNVRRARSTDGGQTFVFETDNLLGDRDLDKTMKYVDPKTLLLPDGRRRLITMRRGPNGVAPQPGTRAIGEIHTFISVNGSDYYHEPGIRIDHDDFTEFNVWSLNDPVMVRLPDGRYRIYVAALVDDDTATEQDGKYPSKWVILSATSH